MAILMNVVSRGVNVPQAYGRFDTVEIDNINKRISGRINFYASQSETNHLLIDSIQTYFVDVAYFDGESPIKVLYNNLSSVVGYESAVGC